MNVEPPATTLVMGIVNVTDDSFSDGGQFLEPTAALARARQLVADGAAIIDVGGESTRPGAHRVSAKAERDRVIPVVSALAAEGITVSVDTMRASVADAALAAGAKIVNDVSGGRADPKMASVVAGTSAPWILMHWRPMSAAPTPGAEWPGIDHRVTHYSDVVSEVRDELLRQADVAIARGIAPERIVLDPGLGFAKNSSHNWALLSSLKILQDTGFRILVGASRKRFLGELLGGRPPSGREAATAAISTLCARAGVWGVRVHDVRSSADSIAVVDAWRTAEGHNGGSN